MKLIGFPPSPNTWKVRARRAHLGVPARVRIHRSHQGRFALAGLSRAQSHRPGAGADRRRSQAVGIGRDHAVHRQRQAEFAVARRCPHPRRHHALAKLALAHFGKEGCEPLLFQRLVKQILNFGSARRGGGGQGGSNASTAKPPCSMRTWRSSLISSERRHARRLLGRGAAVLCRARRSAACAIHAREGMVRPRLGAAVLAETMPQFAAAA